jgi:glycosyltransferase involved in cell wall biosynthesis
MVILQVNKFFFAKGGTERYFFSVSQALEGRGHRIIHFSMRHPDNLPSPQAQYFIEEKDYRTAGPFLRRVPDILSFVRSGEAARKLQALISATRPDIAHLHNIYHQITPSIIPVLKRAGIPAVMTLHDYKLICPNYSLFNGKSYCYRCRGGRFYRAPLTRCDGGSFWQSALLSVEAYWQRMTRVYESIRYFLAPSEFLRDLYVEAGFGEDRVVHLPNFISSESVGEEADGEEGLPQSLPGEYILYFGRLSREKGLHTLLEAMRHLPEVPLVICGDGPLGQRLRDYAAQIGVDNVRFTGYVYKPVLDRIIRRARAVVLPSESPENAPYAALESMALAVPVIASDMGGLPELVEKTGTRPFPRGDAEALAERIQQLWDNKQLAERIGGEGRRVVKDDHDPGRHLNTLEAVYGEAIGSA